VRDLFPADHPAASLAPLVPNARVERIARASHDVMLDAPERVNGLLLEFLARAPAPVRRSL
jgi:pimeloyl-ACP methyl ester carboxylesterase